MMKKCFKFSILFLLTSTLFTCSSNDDDSPGSPIDITQYIVGGELLNNRVSILTFETNGTAKISNVDEEIQLDYTVEDNKITLTGYGSFEVAYNTIVNISMETLNFVDADLIKISDANQLKGKTFAGFVESSYTYFRFSGTMNRFGFGSTYDEAIPAREYDLIKNLGGRHQGDIVFIFYLKNDKLVYESKSYFDVGIYVYFKSDGLELQ